jgi:predicted subunit of tRNA(5-methylaminomethyl-2-thiouridylate) methyltransferase
VVPTGSIGMAVRSTSLASIFSVTPDNSLTALRLRRVAFHTRLKRRYFGVLATFTIKLPV